MGLLGGGTLLLLSALVISFTVAVNKSDKAKKFYESRVKEWLEWSEFLVTWIDAMSCVLAMVTFKIIKKWDVVFYDCFTPLSIWLDSAYTSCLLIQLLFFIGEYSKNYAKICVESTGLGIQMASIFSYVMLKSALDTSFDSRKANNQNFSALVFFILYGFILVLALDAKGEIVAPARQGFGTIALIVAVAAMFLQAAQIFFAIYYRMMKGDFNDDSPDIALVKLAAAVVKVLTQCYYCWLYSSKGYWGAEEKMPLALMTSFALGYYVLIAFERYFGPRRLKTVWDVIVSKIVSGCHRVAARYNDMLIEGRECRIHTTAAMRRRWAEWKISVSHTCNRLIGRQVVAPPRPAHVRDEKPEV